MSRDRPGLAPGVQDHGAVDHVEPRTVGPQRRLVDVSRQHDVGVVPGDQLHLYARVIKQRRGFWSFECKAVVDGELATEAEVSAVVVTREKGEGA